MSKIFIQNPTGENVAVKVTGGDGTVLVNEGPDGAVTTEGIVTNICLSPEAALPLPVVNTTQPVNLDGKFVVKINGEFVPMVFNAVDLKNYFNKENTSGTGIIFEEIK